MGRPDTERYEDELPPLPAPGAGPDERGRAIEARLIARKGGAPSMEAYRRVYAASGAEWPGDDAIRLLHPVADPAV